MTRVLIVDDHAPFRRLARMLLEEQGYEVVGEAADGGEASQAVRELAPELVLLDVNLPDTSGFEVAERICADEDPPAVLLISTHDGNDYGALALRSGARGFVAKDELSGDAIRAILD